MFEVLCFQSLPQKVNVNGLVFCFQTMKSQAEINEEDFITSFLLVGFIIMNINHIARCQVAMDDVGIVQSSHAFSNLSADFFLLVKRKGVKMVGKFFALNEFHNNLFC